MLYIVQQAPIMLTNPAGVADKSCSDLDLATAIKGGDAHAFALLMRRFNRPLYRVARSIVKDDTEAEDALQDAYLLAYRNIAAYRGDASMRTWLTRIVVNEAIARSRKTARRASVIELNGAMDDDGAGEGGMDESRFPEPEKAAMRMQVRNVLEKNIDALPDAFRTVFVMRALEEMTVEEVAGSLGIPEATVRTRFFRARSLLRLALSRQIDFAFEDAFSFDGARCDRIVAAVLDRLRHIPDAGQD
jgi:RNA polymerase sigma-70 factor (ECF subfamily)